ncbi:MAG: hypothetical protein K0S88_3341 [Actinomycetia bacterium]|nr:hypothetical protein [Actinomycetes bacterium]
MISTDLARACSRCPARSCRCTSTTTGNLANPQIRVSLRWKSLRHELAHSGAPKAALAAVDPLIDGPHTAGDMLVAIANLDGIQLLAHLPDAPPRDVARCGMLPDVAPLLAWRQRQLPYVVVVATDRPAGCRAARRHAHRPRPGGAGRR